MSPVKALPRVTLSAKSGFAGAGLAPYSIEMQNHELDGRTAIVTGAGRGIGRAVALALSDLGARVVVNDIGRDGDGQPSAAAVVAEIKERGGHAAVSLDSVSEYDAAARIVEVALESFGSADILVNNAGVAAPGSILEIDDVEFARVTPSHIAGTFNCTRHVVGPMVEAGWGRIVNLVSRAGITGIPGTIAYAMGKGAVFGLTNGASRELAGHGITVNAVCPSSTRTTMVESAMTTLREEGPEGIRRADNLLAQMQSPEAVARPIAALCTDGAASVNGQIFLIEHDQIGLFQPLTVTQRVTRQDDWTAGDLARALGALELHDLADAYA